MLVQHQVAAHMHAPERHRLRHRPLHAAACRRNGDPCRRPPEGRGRIVVLMVRIRVHVARDPRGIGRRAQPHHFCVEAHRHVHRITSGHEKQRIPLRPKLVVLLDCVHRIDLLLDRLRWHRRIEDQHIGSELRLRALRRKRR